MATSLDGFIAGPYGEYDQIVADPDIEFATLYKELDLAVMGRKTYEVFTAQGDGTLPVWTSWSFPGCYRRAPRPGIRVVNDDPREVLAALKKESGRDIWLFGGGSLFRSLLDAQLVDTVKVTVIPVFLGTGVPLLPPGSSTKLILAEHEILRATGIVVLSYSVPGSVGPAPRVGYIKDQKDPSLVGKPSRIPASHPPASRARTRALRSAAKKRNCLNEG